MKIKKMKITPENFEEHQINFLCDITGLMTMEDIPALLILNWASWIIGPKGSIGGHCQ